MQIPKWAYISIGVVVACALGYAGLLLYKRSFGLGKNLERTLMLIKPDAVAAKCAGKIIDRAEQEGFAIVELKKMVLSKETAEAFYEAHKDRMFFHELVDFMTSGPIIAMVLERENAIKTWRDLMGNTDPKEAKEGTLRKQFGTSVSKNAVHGSDSVDAAKREIDLIFGAKN